MKILVIGLDAATMDLIEPWASAGQLPAISSLMSRGYSGRLLSTPNMHSASAWTSILSGLDPGRHGLFVFSDRNFETGRQEFFTGGDRHGDIIGTHLFRQGVTSGFVNVPMTYPAEGFEGSYMVSGLDAPELNELAFYPRPLRADLLDRFPAYRFSPSDLGDLMKAGRVDLAAERWIDLVDVQTAAAEYLIQSRPVDFFMIVYTSSDWAGHNLWNRPDQMLRIYRSLDSAVSRLLKLSDESTQVYLISDHGMGRHSGGSYQLAEWLEKKGYMVRNSRSGLRSTRNEVLAKGKELARAVLPSGVKEKIKASIGGERVKRIQAAEKDSFYSSIDWQRSVAYTEPGRHVINLNLAGRNRDGIVQASEYKKTCERIIADLRDWRDSGGRVVVEDVAQRDEVYIGPFAERASDLYIYWNPSAEMGEPPEEVKARGFWWSGDHRREGVLVAAGPNLRNVSLTAPASVRDLVPTMMYAAGLGVPEGLCGRVLDELLSDDFKSRFPLKFVNEEQGPAIGENELTNDEEKLIEEKLRGLGYL